ncbi:MAG: regulatory protein RecX [Gammaproteobacteria bacterium]|nr:regulatory protein RecX [Gammaproteobacteria bacterium]
MSEGEEEESLDAFSTSDGFDEVQALARQIESRAVYLLGIREHGAKELKSKLLTKFPETPELLAECKELPGLVKSLIEDVLQRCQENNWQSDERYIEIGVRNWTAKGSGPIKIRQKLMQGSYREDLISQYLDWDDSEWLELARSVLLKKYGNTQKPDERNEQAKRMRFLQSRGFSPHLIWQAFD